MSIEKVTLSPNIDDMNNVSDFSLTEYIPTLEGEIAERESLLDHVPTILGSQKSESVTLRHGDSSRRPR